MDLSLKAIETFFKSLIIIGLFLTLVIIFSCAKEIRLPLEERPPKEVMQEGINLFQKGKFSKAIKIFQYVRDTHPFTPYAVLAELKMADAYYYDSDYENALATYQNFEKLHPKNENIPHVLYQIGLCYFNRVLSIDRDQTMTKRALSAFKRVLSEHPESHYAKRAFMKIKICREKLASHEFYVGHFYYRTHQYKSALLRFRNIITGYDDLSIARQAKYYSELCINKLKEESSLAQSIL